MTGDNDQGSEFGLGNQFAVRRIILDCVSDNADIQDEFLPAILTTLGLYETPFIGGSGIQVIQMQEIKGTINFPKEESTERTMQVQPCEFCKEDVFWDEDTELYLHLETHEDCHD